VIPIDTAKLAQLQPGSSIKFEEISLEDAHNIHILHQSRYQNSAPLNH
jgi:allophanate hydrolase subunit 2